LPRNADETRARLIRAAERLFAERGVEAVSLREVNREAGQRNASALQYHFADRDGLVRAILAKHEPAVEARRHDLLDAIEKDDAACDLHHLAAALVVPAAERLSDRDGGRDYLRIVAQLINHHQARVDPISLEDDDNSLNRWRAMVEPEMSPLAVDPLHSRFTARRIMFVELARRAESPRRKDDRLFTSHLVDLVAAILGAPISAETRALLEERARR
jgi:AcrR family transcriptional regulator